VLAVVRQLAAETDMAMLIVTHEMRFARQISERVIVMRSGERLLKKGTPEIIFTSPHESGLAYSFVP